MTQLDFRLMVLPFLNVIKRLTLSLGDGYTFEWRFHREPSISIIATCTINLPTARIRGLNVASAKVTFSADGTAGVWDLRSGKLFQIPLDWGRAICWIQDVFDDEVRTVWAKVAAAGSDLSDAKQESRRILKEVERQYPACA